MCLLSAQNIYMRICNPPSNIRHILIFLLSLKHVCESVKDEVIKRSLGEGTFILLWLFMAPNFFAWILLFLCLFSRLLNCWIPSSQLLWHFPHCFSTFWHFIFQGRDSSPWASISPLIGSVGLVCLVVSALDATPLSLCLKDTLSQNKMESCDKVKSR